MRHAFLPRLLVSIACCAVAHFSPAPHATEPISLIEANDLTADWRFDNGQEFPGAKGELLPAPKVGPHGEDALKLVGDFSNGGGYVQAMRRFDPIPVRELSFFVRAEETSQFTLRLGDSSGQTHQIVLKIDPEAEWQNVSLPLKTFFAERGKAGALTNIARYESWGGAKDGNWHGPATYVCLLLSKGGENAVRTLWFRDLIIQPEPQAVAGAEMSETVRLDEIVDTVHDWRFSHGQEFPGATGELTIERDGNAAPHFALRGDFTQGGAYCAMVRSLDEFQAADTKAIRFEARSKNAKSVTVQISDGTGQTHQHRGFPITADGEWHEVVIEPEQFAGRERWGGANDGKWHGPAKGMVFSVTKSSDPEALQPVLEVRNIRAEMVLPVFSQEPVLTEKFESSDLPSGWQAEGDASVRDGTLTLTRTVEDREKPAFLTSPSIPLEAGRWLVRMRFSSDLESPDNSYQVAISLRPFDSAGNEVASVAVAERDGKTDGWETLEVPVEVPAGAASGQVHIELKKTWGTIVIDDVSISPLSPAPLRAPRAERLLFSTTQLGNLLFPDDPREVEIELICRKPLTGTAPSLEWSLRDYWGAEQADPQTLELGKPETRDGKFVYRLKADLYAVPMEIGRYYEFHADLVSPSEPAFTNHCGIAILPEAIANSYPPEAVPFTARNWDNRIEEYIRLTHRLGVRICGLWGGWSSKPPYKPHAPQLELVRELGMGWLTTTPATRIERGSDEWTEEALRQGMRNFLEAYADERPLIINLGNEPHGTGEVVERNVAAYKVLYEAVKEFDPELPVVATSVEPNEEYFANGYGEYCDAFDFHKYEDAEGVRGQINAYRALQEKYDCVKPIWSTELGLNSQGMPRLRVASEVHRKFAHFFAAGGENVSWFGLLYPDPEGTSFGSSGDSHNIFDSRFRRYNPRLDAIAYYHGVNAIAVKKFIEEKRYDDGLHLFLFRDDEDQSLIVAWKERGREDVAMTLPGITQLEGTAIDGQPFSLTSESGKYQISIDEAPTLLRFLGEASLPSELPPSSMKLAELPTSVSGTDDAMLSVVGSNSALSTVQLHAPPRWRNEKLTSTGSKANQQSFRVTPPESSAIREATFVASSPNSGTRLSVKIPIEGE